MQDKNFQQRLPILASIDSRWHLRTCCSLQRLTCDSTGALMPSVGFQAGGCLWGSWAWLLQLEISGKSRAPAPAPKWMSSLPKGRLLLTRFKKAPHILAPMGQPTCASFSTGGFCSSAGKGRCRQASRKIRHCVSTVRWKAESASCSLVSLDEVRYFRCRSPMPPAGAGEKGPL